MVTEADNVFEKFTTNCGMMLKRNGYISLKLCGEKDFFECWGKFNIQEHMGIDSAFSVTYTVALLMNNIL